MPEGNTEDLTSGQQGSEGSGSGSGEGGSESYVSRRDFESFTSKIEKMLAGNRDSAKDVIEDRVSRAVEPIKQDLTSIKPVLQNLQKAGLLKEGADPDTIQRDLVLSSIVDQVLSGDQGRGGAESARQPAAGQGAVDPQSEVDQILQRHGLTGEEPQLQELANELNQSEVPWYVKLARLDELAGKVAQNKQGNATNLLNLGPGRGRGNNVEAEIQNYIRDAQAVRGKGMAALRPIKEKYRAKGVPVDQIDLARGKVVKLGS